MDNSRKNGWFMWGTVIKGSRIKPENRHLSNLKYLKYSYLNTIGIFCPSIKKLKILEFSQSGGIG